MGPHYSSFDSDNGLAPTRQQEAIIWTNDSLVYWCIYLSLGHNELNPIGLDNFIPYGMVHISPNAIVLALVLLQ